MNTITQAQGGTGWAIGDDVFRLRHWATRDTFTLAPNRDAIMIGSAEGCDVRLQDPKGSVSRQHAKLERDASGWTLHDLNSTNGTRLDGERRMSFALTPGGEIEIGNIKLIAESARFVELERYLSRIIGWSDERLADIDSALRFVRDAAARRAMLVICGAGSLARVARRLHQAAFGASLPFVLVDGAIAPLVETVGAGTLCMSSDAVPLDLGVAFRTTSESPRLILCAPTRDAAAEAIARVERTVVVDLPSIASRLDERERLILEYADDAVAVLGARTNGFLDHELQLLQKVELSTLEEFDELTVRLVAVRNWGATHGARRLGISHVALGGWLRRRGIPT